MLFLAYQKRDVVVIETCDGPIEICFSCGDESGLRIGIDAPSSMRILRREGQRKWCLASRRGTGGSGLPVRERRTPGDGDTTVASVSQQREPVPVFADTDDANWWRHPDDVRAGINGGGEPADPVPDDGAELWT